MKKLLPAAVILLALLPPSGVRADYGSGAPPSLYPPDRFEIAELPVAGAEKPFRFDRACGNIEAPGADNHGQAVWQSMDVPGLAPCTVDGRTHYALFVASAKDHVFIINTDLKTTWELDPAKMTWRQM